MAPGTLTIISTEIINGRRIASVLCYCGKTFSTRNENVKLGYVKSCGCYKKICDSQRAKSRQIKYTEGDKIGSLTFVRELPAEKFNRIAIFKCGCGSEFRGSILKAKSGRLKSCGCYRKKPYNNAGYKHGMTDTPEYKSWCHMKSRCYNPHDAKYKNYGARGIKVCDRWINSFDAFFVDMGQRPSKSHSIDRILVDGDYSPENCRWATSKQQSLNKTNSSFLRLGNRMMTIAEWEIEVGCKKGVLRSRKALGWSDEKIITTPVKL